MSTDFVDRLEEQLVAAAQARQQPAWRRRRARRPLAGSTVLRFAAAVVVMALVVAAALAWLPQDHERRPAGPRAEGSFVVAAGLSSIVSRAGTVWAADPVRGRLVRIDPRQHRVVRRVAVGGEARLAVAGNRLWAVTGDLRLGGSAGVVRVLGLDLRSGRVTARLTPRRPGGAPFVPEGLQVDRGRLWAVGPAGALEIGVRRARPSRFLPAPARDGEPRGVVVDGGTLWTLTAGGRLRHSGPQGRRLAAEVPVPAPATRLLGLADGIAHVAIGRAGLAAVGLSDSRVRWQRAFGDDVGAVARDGGSLWVQTRVGERGRLLRVDAATGTLRSTTGLPEANAVGLVRVRGERWVAWAGGRVTVVR